MNDALNFADILPASFKSQTNHSASWLELELNTNHRLVGKFISNHEILEVHGNIPSSYGEVFGLLRSPRLETPVAVFRASLKDQNRLEFYLDLPDPHDLMALANAEKLEFTRVDCLVFSNPNPQQRLSQKLEHSI